MAEIQFLLGKARPRLCREQASSGQSPAVPEQRQWAACPAAADAAGCRWELRAASGLFCSAYSCDAAWGANFPPR